jgi:hypothetical protein
MTIWYILCSFWYILFGSGILQQENLATLHDRRLKRGVGHAMPGRNAAEKKNEKVVGDNFSTISKIKCFRKLVSKETTTEKLFC